MKDKRNTSWRDDRSVNVVKGSASNRFRVHCYYEYQIDLDALDMLARKAARNKSQTSRDGGVTVRVIKIQDENMDSHSHTIDLNRLDKPAGWRPSSDLNYEPQWDHYSGPVAECPYCRKEKS